MKNAKILLEKVTEKYPPLPNMRHNLTVEDDMLHLQLMIAPEFVVVVFRDQDLQKKVDRIVEEVERLMNDATV